MNSILLNIDLDYAYSVGVELGQTPPGAVEARAVRGTLAARRAHIKDRIRAPMERPVLSMGECAELALEDELLLLLLSFYETGDIE